MQKKFEINRTNIKGGCQSGRNVVTHNSKRDLPLLGGYVAYSFERISFCQTTKTLIGNGWPYIFERLAGHIAWWSHA